MKEAGNHEDCLAHIDRLFHSALYSSAGIELDSIGRIRLDDWELSEPIQAEVNRRWPLVETTNVADLADLDGIRTDFLKIFGFGIDGVDYETDVDPTAKRG